VLIDSKRISQIYFNFMNNTHVLTPNSVSSSPSKNVNSSRKHNGLSPLAHPNEASEIRSPASFDPFNTVKSPVNKENDKPPINSKKQPNLPPSNPSSKKYTPILLQDVEHPLLLRDEAESEVEASGTEEEHGRREESKVWSRSTSRSKSDKQNGSSSRATSSSSSRSKRRLPIIPSSSTSLKNNPPLLLKDEPESEESDQRSGKSGKFSTKGPLSSSLKAQRQSYSSKPLPNLPSRQPSLKEESDAEIQAENDHYEDNRSGKHTKLARENVQSVRKSMGLHWATPDMMQHDFILHDIERHENLSENSAKLPGRSRTRSIVGIGGGAGDGQGDHSGILPANRGKKISSAGEGDPDLNYLTYKGASLQKLFSLYDATIPKISRRLSIYFIGLFFLTLLVIGQAIDESTSWFTVYFTLVAIDIAATILDHAVFIFVIDMVFMHHFNYAYLLRSFNGPLGLFVTAYFAGSFFDNSAAVKSFPLWHRLVTGVVITLMFMCLKNWYSRKQYIAVLERRFRDKLYQLETWNIILSELSSRKPPKTILRSEFVTSSTESSIAGTPERNSFRQNIRDFFIRPNDHPINHSHSHDDEEKQDEKAEEKEKMRHPTTLSHEPSIRSAAQASLRDIRQNSRASVRRRSVSSALHLPSHGDVPGLDSEEKPVKNVFSGIASATQKDEFVDKEDKKLAQQVRNSLIISSKTSSNGSVVTATGERKVRMTHSEKVKNVIHLKKRLRQRRTFWDLAARISTNAGALSVMTYNGLVVLRKRSDAKDFGHLLFQHLSRGNQYVITPELFEELFCPSAALEDERKRRNEEESETPGGASTHLPTFHQKQAVRHVYRLPSNSQDSNEEMDLERGIVHRPRNDKYAAIAGTLPRAHKDGVPDKDEDEKLTQAETLLYKTALELFDPFNLGYVTEEQCMAAVCLVYKENRYAATSLTDYGELHKSLRFVIDVFFYIFILVVLQAFLALDIYNIFFLPFVTMFFSVSFALWPSLGNVLVDILFVFFMIPYEIGHKITIGVDANRVTGWVRGIGILQTTIATLKNETVSNSFSFV
jgi:hypothetical protein